VRTALVKGWNRDLCSPEYKAIKGKTKLGRINTVVNAHNIVFANEKGGTGKSTTAVHVAIALASRGARVACIDLDSRQRTLYRYLENRRDTMQRRDIALPLPTFAVFENDSLARLETLVTKMSKDTDFVVFDTPGRDDKYARFVATRAHTLVTPINDSFVDFDLIGQVDPENFKVKKLSFYAELIWDARKARAKSDGVTIDWVVVRNRLHNMEARNQQRMTDAIAELSRRVGFRSVPGLNERVIYRELFPSGLTLIDKGHLGQLATAHIVARQELRELVSGLALPDIANGTLL
jgi:chromosome partitioning protein